jgi:hypothetical protein
LIGLLANGQPEAAEVEMGADWRMRDMTGHLLAYIPIDGPACWRNFIETRPKNGHFDVIMVRTVVNIRQDRT